MRKEEKITVGESEITVRELTVESVDALFAAFALDRQPTMAERLIDSPIPIEVVSAATGITASNLQANFTPSELSEIWAATSRVNDFLSRLIGRYEGILGLPTAASTGPTSGGSSAA